MSSPHLPTHILSAERKQQMLAILTENPTFNRSQLRDMMQEKYGVQIRYNRLSDAIEAFNESRKGGIVPSPEPVEDADYTGTRTDVPDSSKYGSWDGTVESIPGGKNMDNTPDMRDKKNKAKFIKLPVPDVVEPVPAPAKVAAPSRTPRPSVAERSATPVATTKMRPTMTKVEAPPEPVPKKSDAFVPPKLLNAIGGVMAACKAAGGYDNALGIANAIKACGGVDNFQSAVSLLQKVSQEPAQLGEPEVTPGRTGGSQNVEVSTIDDDAA